MITLEIPDTQRRLYMPSDLSECDTRQYNELSMLIYQLQHGEIDYGTFRVRAVYMLLNMKQSPSANNEEEQEKMSNIYRISELVDSFFEDGVDETKILKQYYVHNPIPKVRPLLRSYYGPKDDFANMQFGEYVDALHFYSEYHETGDKHFLYMLMATLYRPGKWFNWRNPNSYNNDVRQPYNENLVEDRAKKLRHLYFGEVYGFFLLFASFQKYLCSAKIYWQGRELDLSILFKTDNSEGFESTIPGLGMKSTLYTLAESGVFGSIKELRKENAWEILMRMYDLTKRDLDAKAQQKSIKTGT